METVRWQLAAAAGWRWRWARRRAITRRRAASGACAGGAALPLIALGTGANSACAAACRTAPGIPVNRFVNRLPEYFQSLLDAAAFIHGTTEQRLIPPDTDALAWIHEYVITLLNQVLHLDPAFIHADQRGAVLILHLHIKHGAAHGNDGRRACYLIGIAAG